MSEPHCMHQHTVTTDPLLNLYVDAMCEHDFKVVSPVTTEVTLFGRPHITQSVPVSSLLVAERVLSAVLSCVRPSTSDVVTDR